MTSAMTQRWQVTARDMDLDSRRPVWITLSELFLDTSLDSSDLDRIARVLAESPYSLEQLDDILLWEVYPACRSNLLIIAGEWAQFDPEWLESRILRGPSLLFTLWAGTLGRISVLCSIQWRHVKRRVIAARRTARNGGTD